MVRPRRIKVTAHNSNGGEGRRRPAAVAKRMERDQVRQVLCGAIWDIVLMHPLLELAP